MADIRMVARRAFIYLGREYAAGECFVCRPIVAAMLRYQRLAAFETQAEQDEREARRYRRRDMVADQ